MAAKDLKKRLDHYGSWTGRFSVVRIHASQLGMSSHYHFKDSLRRLQYPSHFVGNNPQVWPIGAQVLKTQGWPPEGLEVSFHPDIYMCFLLWHFSCKVHFVRKTGIYSRGPWSGDSVSALGLGPKHLTLEITQKSFHWLGSFVYRLLPKQVWLPGHHAVFWGSSDHIYDFRGSFLHPVEIGGEHHTPTDKTSFCFVCWNSSGFCMQRIYRPWSSAEWQALLGQGNQIDRGRKYEQSEPDVIINSIIPGVTLLLSVNICRLMGCRLNLLLWLAGNKALFDEGLPWGVTSFLSTNKSWITIVTTVHDNWRCNLLCWVFLLTNQTHLAMYTCLHADYCCLSQNLNANNL